MQRAICAYLPPVSWFAGLVSGEPTFIDIGEMYQKQTIRNRCYIDSPNGSLAMTVPVDRSTFTMGKCPMKDVGISYHQDWRRQHWYALETSYFNSAFFEYLQDDFHILYNKEWHFLADFNLALIERCCNLVGIPMPEVRTETDNHSERGTTHNPHNASTPPLIRTDIVLGGQETCLNGREASLNGQGEASLNGRGAYYQVFDRKHGFLPDLSIIDLIFNMGPESILVLKGEYHKPVAR